MRRKRYGKPQLWLRVLLLVSISIPSFPPAPSFTPPKPCSLLLLCVLISSFFFLFLSTASSHTLKLFLFFCFISPQFHPHTLKLSLFPWSVFILSLHFHGSVIPPKELNPFSRFVFIISHLFSHSFPPLIISASLCLRFILFHHFHRLSLLLN